MDGQEQPVESTPSTRGLVVRAVVSTVLIVAAIAVLAAVAKGPAEAASDWIVENLGLWGIGLAVVLADALTLPIPPDTYLLAAVAGHYDPLPILATIIVGSVLAGNLAYALGPTLQRVPLVGPRIEKFRPQGEMLFKKWGLWTVLIAAMTPIPFSVTCWFAGIYKMPFRPFFIGTLGRIPRFVVYYYLFELGWAAA
jgi:membrane protein YqaA with SNARE-associated domain